ncbi:hypothetical protein [Elizabethkingia meningoseptica]|uniref:hypothetical protein n=1 Tax=Elizabethkingia meningoseptica TaxID=238 RepID=UPI0038912B94
MLISGNNNYPENWTIQILKATLFSHSICKTIYKVYVKFILNIFFIFYLVFKPLIPVVDYIVNYDYISRELCVNKNTPEIHCNGKCYLGKELARASQEDTSTDKSKNQGQKIGDSYIPAEISEINITVGFFEVLADFSYKKSYYYLFLDHIFKPPVF